MSREKILLQQKVLMNIPVLQALGIQIEEIQNERVILSAPLSINHNHKGTAFGGSLYTACVSACYSLIYAHQIRSSLTHRDLVITNANIQYMKSVDQDFFIEAELSQDQWNQVVNSLNNKQPYRLKMKARVYIKKDISLCQFEGEFVFLKNSSAKR